MRQAEAVGGGLLGPGDQDGRDHADLTVGGASGSAAGRPSRHDLDARWKQPRPAQRVTGDRRQGGLDRRGCGTDVTLLEQQERETRLRSEPQLVRASKGLCRLRQLADP